MSMPPPPSGPIPPYGPTPPYAPLPSATTAEERNWALAAHAGTFVAAWVALGFLAPLVVLLVKGGHSPFVRRHAVESLNFQVSMLIYLAVSFVLAFVLIGFLLMAIVGIFALVAIILGTVKAANGEEFRYPATIRLIS